MLVLGIETSCDETAAAVVRGPGDNGVELLSSVVASQDDLHAHFGGIVPEVASRRHVQMIVPVIAEAMQRAGVSWEEIDGVACTSGPGLIGSLVVGAAAAKALARARGLPIVGIHHLEGHIYAGGGRGAAAARVGARRLGRAQPPGADERPRQLRGAGPHSRRRAGRGLREGGTAARIRLPRSRRDGRAG